MEVSGRHAYCLALAAMMGFARLAVGATGDAGEAVHLEAGRLGVVLGVPITNSMVATWLVALVAIAVTQCAMRNATLVPGRLQGVIEGLLEGLLSFLTSLMGEHLARRTFWLLATLFLFILTANWSSLLPGFGSIGWGVESTHGLEITRPLLRGANADLNMTFGMALLLMGFWLFWSIQEQGIRGFLRHLFGAKGDTKGLLGAVLGVVFFAAGVLEVVSISFRPISLSLRLFGNTFAGEAMLETLLHRFPAASWVLPVPFYFVELLVGLVQAGVFTMLAAIFVMLSCDHGEDVVSGHSVPLGGRGDP